MQNILFRADSSSDIGLGHIMRDLVLAKEFQDANITFATQNLRGNINHKIVEAGYDLEILKSNDKKELVKLIKKLNIGLLIIDNYKIKYKQEKYLKEKTGVKILALDDTYEKHYCDILLNHNIGANPKKYKEKVPSFCELRCGEKYTLLRDEFYKEKKKIKKRNSSKIKRIFIAIGGVDHTNINIKILKSLTEFKNIEVNIVTSSSNQNLKKLQNYIKNKKWIKLHIDSTKIARLMRQNDFAIITPSVTANEAYFMQLPFIVILTASNQKESYLYLKKHKYLTLKEFHKKELTEKVKTLIKAKRVLQTIELINFTDLKEVQKSMILQWRNNDSIKKWMFTSDDISIKNHLDFIQSLSTHTEKLYFLVKNREKYIGVINFTNIVTDSSEIGIYSNPSLKGMGAILMQTIINYAFDTLRVKKLIAKVFSQNERAFHLYKKCHFLEINRKKYNNKELICMELKNENR